MTSHHPEMSVVGHFVALSLPCFWGSMVFRHAPHSSKGVGLQQRQNKWCNCCRYFKSSALLLIFESNNDGIGLLAADVSGSKKLLKFRSKEIDRDIPAHNSIYEKKVLF